ncbi:hypothetical protein BRADI_1g59896v3 [Brachypodium distachyon]|uniref:Uncharacterized protein n=1 Tax=Brachypodium distachyon TaxID=15368 RepID=A0A2K2DSJ1_BRADI|nr:hypothetical protein BRADI_1g59896v3 [Brachypodium distachyon]PNT77245.1 hypothetical protein BRADI_1g59896v3 [Brachypodium distachyon]
MDSSDDLEIMHIRLRRAERQLALAQDEISMLRLENQDASGREDFLLGEVVKLSADSRGTLGLILCFTAQGRAFFSPTQPPAPRVSSPLPPPRARLCCCLVTALLLVPQWLQASLLAGVYIGNCCQVQVFRV